MDNTIISLALLFLAAAISLSYCDDVADSQALLATLQARGKLLEETVRTEEALSAQLKREVAEHGTRVTTCYKRLAAAENFINAANDPTFECKVPKQLRNCQDWFNAGYKTDGLYTVDPDGDGGVKPFTVECQFSDPYNPKDTRVFMNIHHDSEERYEVGKCKDPLCFQKKLTYVLSKEQIVAAMMVSRACQQDIVYDCYGAKLLKGGYGAWYSRDGVKQNYWGGAKPGSGQCACGLTGKCHKGLKTCSCDAGDLSWKSDRGFLTDRATLPVSKVALGDTAGNDQSAFIRVAHLRCYGYKS